MPKIDVEPVRGAKHYPDPTDPDAVAEIDDGFGIYSDLRRLLDAEQREEREALGYGRVTSRKVTDKMLRQALRRAAQQ